MDDQNPIVLHDYSRVPYRILRGTVGLEMPSFDVKFTRSPGVDGIVLDPTVTASRDDVRLPIFMWAEDRNDLRRLKSELAVSLNPKRGAGWLELSEAIGTPTGVARVLRAVYRGGLEGDGADMGGRWWSFTLQFQAVDPYWYSADRLRATWVGLPSAPFLPFTLPFTLSESGVVPGEPLEVTGDADTWPSFDMRGPFTRVRVEPVGGSTFWEVNRRTNGSEMLRLNTKPGEEELRLFTSPDGGVTWVDAGSALSVLHPDSWFVPLEFEGQLQVTADETTRNTLVELSALEAWNTAP